MNAMNCDPPDKLPKNNTRVRLLYRNNSIPDVELGIDNFDTKKYWGDTDTRLLISLAEERYEDMLHAKKKKTVWFVIASKMRVSGFDVTPDNCYKKWKNLIRTYRAIKINQRKTGRPPIRFSYFNEMERILGSKLDFTDRKVPSLYTPIETAATTPIITTEEFAASVLDRTPLPFMQQEDPTPTTAENINFDYINAKKNFLEKIQKEWDARREEKNEKNRVRIELLRTKLELEERKINLLEQLRPRSRRRSLSKPYPTITHSSQSVLKNLIHSATTAKDFTIVLFSFCEEEFPYRTKIPGRQITLKQFKECLPQRGNYRYFFKTECEELNNQVIQEEIRDDSDLLPLWQGSINAQVKMSF